MARTRTNPAMTRVASVVQKAATAQTGRITNGDANIPPVGGPLHPNTARRSPSSKAPLNPLYVGIIQSPRAPLMDTERSHNP